MCIRDRTHTLINDFEGLDKNSIILFEQIRTIDKQRLRKYVGMPVSYTHLDVYKRQRQSLPLSLPMSRLEIWTQKQVWMLFC